MSKYANNAVVSTITDGMISISDITKKVEKKLDKHIEDEDEFRTEFNKENKDFKDDIDAKIMNFEDHINKYRKDTISRLDYIQGYVTGYIETDRAVLSNYIKKQNIAIVVLSVLNLISIGLNIFL